MAPLRELSPPQAVIEVARCTMGGVDLDPFSTPEVNHIVQAARFLDRDPSIEIAAGRHWSPTGGRRVLLAVPSKVALGRALANKLLQEYRGGHIRQAIFWPGSNELLTACPWIWDFPICLPFRRLAACFWDDELEKTIRVPPSDWTPIVYLPPATPSEDFAPALARFHAAAGVYGRVVFDEWSGENRWQNAYEALMRKPYSYEP